MIAYKIVEDFNKLNDSLTRLNKISKGILEDTPFSSQKRSQSNMYAGVDDDEKEQEQHLIKNNYEHQKLENERDFQDQIIQQREEEIQIIQQQMRQVNDIFRDLATLIQEQGEMIDNISFNIDTSHKNVKDGAQSLVDANQSSKSSRSRLCCLAIFITIVAMVAVIIVLIFFSRK